MITENTASLRSRRTPADDRADELLDRALNELNTEDQWVNEFIKRLNYAVQDLGRQ